MGRVEGDIGEDRARCDRKFVRYFILDQATEYCPVRGLGHINTRNCPSSRILGQSDLATHSKTNDNCLLVMEAYANWDTLRSLTQI